MRMIILALLLPALSGFGQESVSEIKKMAFGNPMDASNQSLINMLNRSESAKDIAVMRFDQWQPMKVIGIDSTILYVDSANYHVELDKILFMRHGSLYELHADKVMLAVLADHDFIRVPYKSEANRSAPHYFEILVAGEYSLLVKYDLKKKVTNSHPMGFPGTKEEEIYQQESFYYLRLGSRIPDEVPSKKQDFIMIFRKNRPQMVDFAKENRTSLRSAEDLTAIFNYYNALAGQL